MVKIICVILAALQVLTGISIISRDDLYGRVATVREIDEAADTVLFEDTMGFLWEIHGAEDWESGDGAALIMSRNYTPEIYDDRIVRATYCGAISF